MIRRTQVVDQGVHINLQADHRHVVAVGAVISRRGVLVQGIWILAGHQIVHIKCQRAVFLLLLRDVFSVEHHVAGDCGIISHQDFFAVSVQIVPSAEHICVPGRIGFFRRHRRLCDAGKEASGLHILRLGQVAVLHILKIPGARLPHLEGHSGEITEPEHPVHMPARGAIAVACAGYVISVYAGIGEPFNGICVQGITGSAGIFVCIGFAIIQYAGICRAADGSPVRLCLVRLWGIDHARLYRLLGAVSSFFRRSDADKRPPADVHPIPVRRIHIIICCFTARVICGNRRRRRRRLLLAAGVLDRRVIRGYAPGGSCAGDRKAGRENQGQRQENRQYSFLHC